MFWLVWSALSLVLSLIIIIVRAALCSVSNEGNLICLALLVMSGTCRGCRDLLGGAGGDELLVGGREFLQVVDEIKGYLTSWG